MAQVKVWNDNTHTYKETFKDESYVIPAGGFITMERNKAIQFLGSFAPMIKNAQGAFDEAYFKKLRIEMIATSDTPVDVKRYVCNQDGKEFTTQAALDAWIDENHLDKLTDPKVADDRRKGKR